MRVYQICLQSSDPHFQLFYFRLLLAALSLSLCFHSLTIKIDLLDGSLGYAEILFRSSQIELQLDQIDLRKATLSRQLLQTSNEIPTGVYVIFAEFHFAFRLLDFSFFYVQLRGVRSITLNEALFFIAYILRQRSKLGVPTANLIRAQHEQLLAAFDSLTFAHRDTANHGLARRLNWIGAGGGDQHKWTAHALR